MSQNQNPAPSIGQVATALTGLGTALNAIFGAKPQSAPQQSTEGITLRSGTSSVFVPASEISGRNVGGLFTLNADKLGGVDVGNENATLRDTRDGTIDFDAVPVVGHEYVLTISRDTKGLNS